MEYKRCAKLVLNTSLFYPQGTGSIAGAGTMDPTMGYADQARINSTFTNLNWKQIIGPYMWEHYDEFNLVLVDAQYLSSGGTSFGASGSGFGMIMKASGLDWVNQTYDVYSKCNTDEAVILVGITTLNPDSPPTFNACTFRKPSGNGARDFNIKLYRALDGLQTSTGDRAAAYVLVFNIYGVENSPK